MRHQELYVDFFLFVLLWFCKWFFKRKFIKADFFFFRKLLCQCDIPAAQQKTPLKSLIMNKGMYLFHGCIESLLHLFLNSGCFSFFFSAFSSFLVFVLLVGLLVPGKQCLTCILIWIRKYFIEYVLCSNVYSHEPHFVQGVSPNYIISYFHNFSWFDSNNKTFVKVLFSKYQLWVNCPFNAQSLQGFRGRRDGSASGGQRSRWSSLAS